MEDCYRGKDEQNNRICDNHLRKEKITQKRKSMHSTHLLGADGRNKLSEVVNFIQEVLRPKPQNLKRYFYLKFEIK